MPRTTVITGMAFVLLGIGLFLGLMEPGAPPHWTVLIPAGPGVLLTALGILAARVSAWRKHLMHAAMALALLVVLGGLGRGVPGLLAGPDAAALASSAMAVIALVYLIAGIRSFVEARRGSSAGAP